MNLKSMVEHYIEAVTAPENGWGQNCHPKTGEISHAIMNRGWRLFGHDEFMAALEKEMAAFYEKNPNTV